MAVIVDLNLVCIICLQNDCDDMVSIQSKLEEADIDADPESDVTIAERIAMCSNLNLKDINVKLSNLICSSCLGDLSAAWRFRKNCETSNTLFRSIQREESLISLENYELDECGNKQTVNPQQRNDASSEIKPFLTSSVQKVVEAEGIFSDGSDSEQIIPEFNIVEYVDERDEEEENENENELVKNGAYYECLRDEMLDDDCENVDKSSDQIKKEIFTETLIMSKKNFRPTLFDEHDDSNDEICNVQIKQEIFETATDEDDTKIPIERLDDDNILPIENKSDHVDNVKDGRENNNYPTSVKNTYTHIAPSTIVTRTTNLKTQSAAKKFVSVKRKSRVGTSAKICELCGNTYKYQHALNAHMRRHNNDRQFACELCDKAFVSNVELRRHMRVHTGHKPYACQFCDRRFSDFGSRIKHERTHTGERPYHCDTCNKSFAYPHVLTVHLRTHTGEKKFQCTLCGRGFTKKAYLLSHLETHKRCADISNISSVIDTNSTCTSGKTKRGPFRHREIAAIKTITLDECMLTATGEIMNEPNGVISPDGIGSCVVEFEETIDEEHLEGEQGTNDGEYSLGVQT